MGYEMPEKRSQDGLYGLDDGYGRAAGAGECNTEQSLCKLWYRVNLEDK